MIDIPSILLGSGATYALERGVKYLDRNLGIFSYSDLETAWLSSISAKPQSLYLVAGDLQWGNGQQALEQGINQLYKRYKKGEQFDFKLICKPTKATKQLEIIDKIKEMGKIVYVDMGNLRGLYVDNNFSYLLEKKVCLSWEGLRLRIKEIRKARIIKDPLEITMLTKLIEGYFRR